MSLAQLQAKAQWTEGLSGVGCGHQGNPSRIESKIQFPMIEPEVLQISQTIHFSQALV